MSVATGRHVAVIGAGIIGVVSAIEALRDGNRVTLIEPGTPGGQQAASYGNAGWLGTHSVIPPAMPGVWRKVPHYLMDPLGPLAIRWPYFPKALPWLARYLWSGWTEAKVEETARALRDLLKDAPALHKALAAEAGLSDLIEHQGVMHIYPSRAAFEADRLAWDIRRRVGVQWLELSEDEMRQREPDLDRRYQFGILVEEAGRCRDPGGYVAGLADHARALGADIISARATGFRVENGRLKAVVTDRGEIACDAAVVAAGIRSRQLCASIGDRLPLETERGYHIMIENADVNLRTSLMSDTKMAVNAMNGGLRTAGQVEIAGLEAAPDWRRAEILRDHLLSLFPKLPRDLPMASIKVWLGHRPSMPDGRPCIGYARATRDVVYAFGHGHVGLVGSACTGRLVAQLIAGREPEIPIAPFAPQRYL
jgi:D-amino-acid dehydrogenase